MARGQEKSPETTLQTLAPLQALPRKYYFSLDSDLRFAAEDQAQAMGLTLEAWLQTAINDALRAYLGV